MTVRWHVRVLLGATCVLGATATLAAASPPPEPPPPPPDPIVYDQIAADQVAVDPYYYNNYQPPPVETPPPVEEYVPSESIIATASGMQAWLSQPSGLKTAAHGGTVGFAWLQRHGDFPTGVEVNAVFLFGDRASQYALTSRLVGSPKLGNRLVVPFAAIGLAVGASRVVETGASAMEKDPPMTSAKYGFAIGPSAALGLHGFLGKKYYWRASAGFVAAGVGMVTADVGLGMVVD